MTVSELIYSAWQNTEKPLIYQTADAKGNVIEKQVEFLNPTEHQFYDAEYDGVCNLCGEYTHGGIPIKKVFSAWYMDWPMHKAPEATHACLSCAFCIMTNPATRAVLFKYPLVAEKELHLCNRKQLREWLLNPPEPPFVMIMPTSQKKHLFAKSRISYNREKFWCNLEEITVPVGESFPHLIESIEMLRGLGINKTQIESGVISAVFFKNYGIAAADWTLELMHKIQKDQSFSLALEVAQKMTEEEAGICLKQRMK